MRNSTKDKKIPARNLADTVSCILCGGPVTRTAAGYTDDRFGMPGEWNIGRCGSCGLVQQSPCPDPGRLSGLYSQYYNFPRRTPALYRQMRDRFLLSPLYVVWSRLEGDISFHNRKGSGTLLDVGCNEGRGLMLYKRNGYTVQGIEINPLAADRAREKGFSVAEAPLPLFEPDGPFDVVVLSQVLEHEIGPDRMLECIHGLLNPGGELWISTPNYRSIQRSIFGRRWINWHVPFHIAYYTPDILCRMLADHGFVVEKTTCPSPALWTAQSIISWLYVEPGAVTAHMRNPAMVAILSVLSTIILAPLYLIARVLKRGDCIKIVARKK